MKPSGWTAPYVWRRAEKHTCITDLVRIDQAGGVARVTLNRPDIGNAIDIQLARALLETAIACDEDTSVRCVLITGAGRVLCVGGNINGELIHG